MIQRRIRFTTSGALCAFMGAALAASPAMAQETPDATPSADAAQPEAAAAAQSDEPESANEVLVTAQRRSQRLQDVPIAVTAITAEQSEAQGITSTHSLAQAVTGLTILEAGGYVQPFIRGVGSTVTNLGEQGSTATYIDGVYMPTVNGQLYELANIQSVEVLKGPQGTLFGRNANTGAIIITTRQPQFTTEGRFQIGYGNYNAITAQGFITAPISDNVAFSIAGNWDSHDGWFTHLPSGDRIGDSERWTIRGNLLFNVTPNLSITLSGDIMRTDDASPILIQPISGYQGYNPAGPAPGNLFPGGPYDFIGDSRPRYLAEQEGISARIRWDAGPFTLTSTTANRWFYTESIDYDSDTTPFLYSRIGNTEVGTNFTQEVVLNSNGDGAFSWVVGAFYLRQDADYDPLNILSPAGLTTITAQQVTQAYAGFVDGTYRFGDFELTAGLRYSYETKRYDGQRNGVQLVNNANDSWDSFTPRIVLSYNPNRNVLAYASFSQGFKSGTFNANGLSATPVRPETVDAYEVGLKLTLAPGTVLNISAFHYQIQDLQVQALNPLTNLILVANAAEVESNGVDVELSLRPVRGLDLRFGASYLDAEFSSFPNAQIFIPVPNSDGRNQSVIRDVTGNQNVRSPKFTFNASANYRIDLGNGASIVPSANFYYSSAFYWEVGNRLREDPHAIVNAQLTYNFPGDRVSITAWVRNLFDELHFRNIQAAAQADRRVADSPRVFGVRVGYQF
jgi:iron complex outermembrane receptor protein